MNVQLDSVEHSVKAVLVGAPDLQQVDGRPFIAERVRVSRWSGRVCAYVTGRAIRKDGSLGVSQRFIAFNVQNSGWHDDAPGWLLDALRDAGIKW